MKTAHIESVANRKSRRCCVNILMDEDRNINARIVQRRRGCANISMDIFAILYVVTTQRRRCCAGIPMNVFLNMNVLISQLGTSCSFDSPGLASESEGYPGSFVVSGNNAVGVVPFIPRHFIAAFHTENVQHLRR